MRSRWGEWRIGRSRFRTGKQENPSVSAEYHELSYLSVFFATLLIVINGAVSIILRLDLERRLLVASLRTVVQLLAIGVLLEWVFRQKHWGYVAAWMVAMTLVAGVSAVGRVERRYAGMRVDSLTGIVISSWLLTGIALSAIVPPKVWEEQPAQYAIPLLGMVLGNTLNGISLGLGRLTENLAQDRDRIEMRLTLGATRWEAARDSVRHSVRTGMIPVINSMMVVGLVSLPGMMTGQLISGVSPAAAVKYQIVIMFLVAAGTASGTILVVLLGYRRMFNTRHQFLVERIGPKK
ncbi:MAG: iron export ABC transporter permease subunit FetB [Planctomycetaceae bacterium]|nr:iron export ABC transporter permease subunit FetB [Planctomycetaceae bacterium]